MNDSQSHAAIKLTMDARGDKFEHMRILVTGRLPEAVLENLRAVHEIESNPHDKPMERSELLANVADKQGVLSMITDRIDLEFFEAADQVKMVANCAVGYDNIDLEEASKRGVLVSNTPGVLTDSTADLALTLMLSAARRVVEGDKRVREGRFKFWAPLHFLGSDVAGKTLGIVGLGEIGQAVARRARGFGMSILYHKRSRVSEELEKQLGAQYADLKTLLSESDFVSLHVNLTEKTRHLIGRDELNLMKPSAYLINTSRGPVVDEQALVEVLREKRIAGAGLDVYENEPALTPGLIELENATLLPHVGSATADTRHKMAALAAENLLAGLRGETPPNCLNPGALD